MCCRSGFERVMIQHPSAPVNPLAVGVCRCVPRTCDPPVVWCDRFTSLTEASECQVCVFHLPACRSFHFIIRLFENPASQQPFYRERRKQNKTC